MNLQLFIGLTGVRSVIDVAINSALKIFRFLDFRHLSGCVRVYFLFKLMKLNRKI